MRNGFKYSVAWWLRLPYHGDFIVYCIPNATARGYSVLFWCTDEAYKPLPGACLRRGIRRKSVKLSKRKETPSIPPAPPNK